jgi:hypothetical protein
VKSVWHKDSREKLNTAVRDTALTSERTVPPLLCYASRRFLTPCPYVLSLADPLPALPFTLEVLSVEVHCSYGIKYVVFL